MEIIRFTILKCSNPKYWYKGYLNCEFYGALKSVEKKGLVFIVRNKQQVLLCDTDKSFVTDVNYFRRERNVDLIYNLTKEPVSPVKKRSALIHSLIKKQMIMMVKEENNDFNFNESLNKVLTDIYYDGYDKGLADKEKMYQRLNEPD